MNFDYQHVFKLKVDAGNLQQRFCKIYENVITNYFVFNKDLISDAKEILNSGDEKNFKTDLPSYRLAFLLSFGVQDTCVSVQKFYESLLDCGEMIGELSKMKNIKLCCLGSESLPTVIGVCQVIDEIVEQFGPAGKFYFSEIRVLIIDQKGSWRRLCGCIVDTVNSYFKKIELKLDFMDNLSSGSSEEFIDRIQKSDLVIVSRFRTEYQRFILKYFLQMILNKMKENAILFYFDSNCKSYYDHFRYLLSMAKSFTEIKSCHTLNTSFEDLENEQYCLDLPVNWNTNFQPFMFSTWMKNSETRVKSLKKNDVQIASDVAKQPDTANGKTAVLKEKKKAKPSKKLHNLGIYGAVVINSLTISASKKQKSKNGSKANKKAISTQKSQSVIVSSDVAISKKVIPKAEMANSSTATGCENPIIPTSKTKKNKTVASKVPDASAQKKTTLNQENPPSSSNQTENKKASPSVTKVTASKTEKKNKPSEKSGKNASAPEKTASKGNDESKSDKKNVLVPTIQKTKSKKVSPVKQTKRNNIPENIRLTGKFARMDLEKKNKDERHRMRAKKASVARYANFDYED